jgi:hypothetical protein
MAGGSGSQSRLDSSGNRSGKTLANRPTQMGKEFPYDKQSTKERASAWDELKECMCGEGEGLEPSLSALGGGGARLRANRGDGGGAMIQPKVMTIGAPVDSHWHAAEDALDDVPFTIDSVIDLDVNEEDDTGDENPEPEDRLTDGPNDNEENPR